MKKYLCLFNLASLVAGGAGYGLFTIPLSTIFSWTGKGYIKMRRRYPRFVLGYDTNNKRELSVDAYGLLKHKEDSGKEIPFEKVTIRWGPKPLKIHDVLVNSNGCESGKYYVARHVWENNYWLDDGQTVTLTSPSKDFCGGGSSKKPNTITLNFQKTSGGQASANLTIEIKSCKFKWSESHGSENKVKNLSLNCKGKANANGNEEEITLTLGKDAFKE